MSAIQHAERSPLRIFLKTIVARAYPRVVAANRHKSWLFLDMALPMVGALAMVLVYQGLHAPRQYLGFVVMGGAMLAFWQNVLWTMGAQFSWDRGNGTLELMAVSPTSFEAVLLGMAGGAMIMTTVRAAFIILIGSLVFNVTYTAGGLLPAIGVFLLTLGALYGMGMLLASLFLFYSREAWHLGDALQEPVNFLSGLYFPVKALGIPAGTETLLVAAQVPIFALLAGVALRYLESRARKDGKLVTRWE
ncbi:MAG: ABC transporter permease [Chloroflexi bacterium]|nr:MAG: ABC transporter permease [Chloroflexota bacterium]